MTQLTVEDIDDELNACIREFAEREGLTPSQAALCLLRKSVGLEDAANGASGNSGGEALPDDGASVFAGWNIKKWSPGEDAPKPSRSQDESGKKDTRDPALDRLVGSMTAAEAAEVDAAIEEMFENIDEEMWR